MTVLEFSSCCHTTKDIITKLENGPVKTIARDNLCNIVLFLDKVKPNNLDFFVELMKKENMMFKVSDRVYKIKKGFTELSLSKKKCLRSIRNKLQLTQEGMADLIGVSNNSIARWENFGAGRSISIENLKSYFLVSDTNNGIQFTDKMRCAFGDVEEISQGSNKEEKVRKKLNNELNDFFQSVDPATGLVRKNVNKQSDSFHTKFVKAAGKIKTSFDVKKISLVMSYNNWSVEYFSLLVGVEVKEVESWVIGNKIPSDSVQKRVSDILEPYIHIVQVDDISEKISCIDSNLKSSQESISLLKNETNKNSNSISDLDFKVSDLSKKVDKIYDTFKSFVKE